MSDAIPCPNCQTKNKPYYKHLVGCNSCPAIYRSDGSLVLDYWLTTIRREGGLATIEHKEYGSQVWHMVKTRKDFICRLSLKKYPKGTYAFTPILNPQNRGDRIADENMKGPSQ